MVVLKSLRFRPAQIHAQQHLRPILGFGAAGAGVDAEDGGAAIMRTAEGQLQTRRLAIRASSVRLRAPVRSACPGHLQRVRSSSSASVRTTIERVPLVHHRTRSALSSCIFFWAVCWSSQKSG